MKKKYIVSALVALLIFALTFIILDLNLILCIILGLLTYYATYLVLPNKKIDIEETKDTDEIIEYGYMQIEQIKEVLEKIEDQEIRKNFKVVCEDVEKILKEIKSKPKKTRQIQNFISYYLPVSINILKKYDEVENQRLTSQDSKDFMTRVLNMSSKIKEATKNQLNSMYNEEIINTSADIKVFETMLKSDGLLSEKIISENRKE